EFGSSRQSRIDHDRLAMRAGINSHGASEATRIDVGASPLTFEETYRAHFAFVWRSLRRLGIAEDDATDAAQDVFIVVHRKLPEFAGRSKVTTWLYGICFRVASERRRAVPRPRLGEEEAAAFIGRQADPGAIAEHHQGLALLERILDRL